MADLIKNRFDLDVQIKPGAVGEFSVVVDGKIAAEKGFNGFPAESEVLEAVGALLKT